MSDTGWCSPTSHSGTYSTWVNPQNAYASDDVYSIRYASEGANFSQSWERFNFNIPAGATITGVQVKVEHHQNSEQERSTRYAKWYSASDIHESSWQMFSLQNGLDMVAFLPSVMDTTNLWGRTPIASDFSNNNFYVMLNFKYGDPGGMLGATFSLDQIQVKVFYTESTSVTSQGYIID